MMDSVAEDLVAVYMSEDPVNKEAFEEDLRVTFGLGNIESLNVAMAATVLSYELMRQNNYYET